MMKVMVSESESYEMAIPNEISFSDFDKLVKKLNVVVSMLKGETSAKQISAPLRKYKREEIIYLMKTYYTYGKDSAQFIEALNKVGTSLKKVRAGLQNWIKANKISPEEVGLTEFPPAWARLDVNKSPVDKNPIDTDVTS